MFCVKTHNKTFEMSASDQRQKVEWIQGSLAQIPPLYAKYDDNVSSISSPCSRRVL